MTEAVLTPEETRELSIWGVLGKRRIPAWRWMAALTLAALAWLGALAFIAQFRPNQVWALIAPFAPNKLVYFTCLGGAAAIAALSLIARQKHVAALGAAVTAFLGAFWFSGLFYRLYNPEIDVPFASLDHGLGFAIQRLWWGLPAFAALGAAALVFRGEPRPHLGFGDWSVVGRDASAKEKPRSYWRRLVVGFALVSLILAVLLQAPLGFAPATSGRLLALLPAILLAALANAAIEEMAYRGFLQPAFMRVLGAGAGMWVTGILFGLAHWGVSVGLLAALPVSLLIGVGAVIWGKAAYETRGLAWPIAAHFMIDVAIMSAFFV